jgi:putative hydrolase of the HAD superfamily
MTQHGDMTHQHPQHGGGRWSVVFDLGAVVLTWQPAAMLALAFPDEAASPESAQALARQVFAHADWLAFDAGHCTLDAVAARTQARLGLDGVRLRALLASISRHLTPMPDTVALIESLLALRDRDPTQGPGVYYLSNMPAPYARELQALHPFLHRMDGGIFSGDVGLIKPDPALYQLLQDRFALEPSRTVFTDDHAPNIAAAQAFGWQAVLFESARSLGDILGEKFNIKMSPIAL